MGASTYAGLQKSFHISEEVAILTVSLYVLGLGVGPLFLGPTSEFVGRRIVYLWSLTGFLRKSV
jgi:MFS family permease